MEKPIIEIKNIGKKYQIQQSTSRYVSLRDVIANMMKNPLRFLRKKIHDSFNKKEDFWALKNISLNINKGDIIGIIGHNGAGKSTLLKILTGITPPTEGEIIMRGKVASLLEVGTGFHPELSGRENIFLNGAILGMTKKEIECNFDKIVDFAGVRKFIDNPVKYYSSGMYVRLAFSVAAHMNPDILLVDEVLAVGDSEFQKKCIGKMEEATKETGRTIILVSHNMNAIKKLCSKTIILDGGKLVFFGDTEEAVNTYLKIRENISQSDLTLRTDRQGNGNLRITNCYLENENKQKITSISSGDELNIIFEYKCKDKTEINNIVLGANICDEDGQSLIMLHNQMTHTDIGKLTGTGKITCKINKLPLTQGTYFLNVRITSDDIELDYITNVIKIEVAIGDYFKTGSIINHSKFFVDHSWNINK